MDCPTCGNSGIDITAIGDASRQLTCGMGHKWTEPLYVASDIPATERFLREIVSVCRNFNMALSITNDDEFVVVPFGERAATRILNAEIDVIEL